jgi:hypothetical protein
VLENGGVRREVICECGQVIMFLGRQEYRFNGWAARHRLPSRERWRRSRELLFSAAGRRRWRSHVGHRAGRGQSSGDERYVRQAPGEP